ncbi:MAG: hypothetical protein HC904_14910 [Blastochloris sp.]|nr:hypothetical protein [Blastochloris sp.]
MKMPVNSPIPRRFILAQYLDGLLFWSLFAGASVMMLWLLSSTAKNLLRESVATRVVTLSRMTASSLSPRLQDPASSISPDSLGSIPLAHLKAIQQENPELSGLAVVDPNNTRSPLLSAHFHRDKDRESLLKLLDSPAFQDLLREAQNSTQPVFSAWEFLNSSELPLFVDRVKQPEYTFTAVPGWPGLRSENIPVVILVFDAPRLQQPFLRADDNTAAVLAITTLVATILGWFIQTRSRQRQQAVNDKLTALHLLKQRDFILARVTSAMDEILAETEFERAMTRLLREIQSELVLYSCQTVFDPLHPSVTNPPSPTPRHPQPSSPLLPLDWSYFLHEPLSLRLNELREGRSVVLTQPRLNSEEARLFEKWKIQALALIPMILDKRLLGILVLADQQPDRVWDSGLLDSIKLAADLYATAYGRREQDAKLLESSKMQALGRMTGGVAHEFNNLLHIISGNLEQLLHTKPPSSPERSLLDKIVETSRRGSHIVEQMLNATRQSTSTIREGSLNDLAQKTVTLFQSVIKKKCPTHG